MKVQELMTMDPTCCMPDSTLQQVAQLMRDADCGCIPVVEDQESHRLVGVATDRDIACRGVAAGKDPSTPIREVMTTDPTTCQANDEVETVERIMTEEQVRRVPVVDSRNRCLGIVAQADLALNRRGVSEDEVGRVVEGISEPTHSSKGGAGARLH